MSERMMNPIKAKSSISQHSRTLSRGGMSSDDTAELTDDELKAQVDELKKQVKILNLENEILEKTIMRVDPTLLNGVQQALEYAMKMQSCSSLNVGSFVKSVTSKFISLDSPSRMLTFSSPSRVSNRKFESSARLGGTVVFGSGPRINIIERTELVTTEMVLIVNSLEKSRTRAAKKQALLKAQLEEIRLRETDIEKASVMFNQQVIIEGWDKIAQRIPAEVWVRFMMEWFKIVDSKIGKLRLRTSTLNTQYSKINGQIRMKEELSESLRAVDFEKLKIENEESERIIERKILQLTELKSLTGDANLTLTIHKKAMMDQNNYLANLLKAIRKKEVLTVELDKERDKIQAQVNDLDQKLVEVKAVRMAYEVPDIMDYVKIKAEYTELTNAVRLLENRLHINQIALASINRKLMNIMMSKNSDA